MEFCNLDLECTVACVACGPGVRCRLIPLETTPGIKYVLAELVDASRGYSRWLL